MNCLIFDPAAAAKEQEAYCERHELPMFAPESGICPRCGRSIFQGPSGISVEEAGRRLITGCPHCDMSFVE